MTPGCTLICSLGPGRAEPGSLRQLAPSLAILSGGGESVRGQNTYFCSIINTYNKRMQHIIKKVGRMRAASTYMMHLRAKESACSSTGLVAQKPFLPSQSS